MVLSVILISQHFPFSSLLKPTRDTQNAFDLFDLFGLHPKSSSGSDYLSTTTQSNAFDTQPLLTPSYRLIG